MDTVGVRDLANRASAVLEQLEETGQPVLVTRHGRPVAVLSAIDEEAFHDYVLASAPEFVRDRSEAEDRWARGEQDGTPLEDVIAEFDREPIAEHDEAFVRWVEYVNERSEEALSRFEDH